MAENQNRTVEERRRVETRRVLVALVISLLVHAILILSYPSVHIPPSPFSAAGPRAGDFRAAPGGGSATQIVRIPPPRPIQPPAVPLVTVEITDPVDLDPDPALDLDEILGEAPGELPGPPGIEGGQGRGDGGTAEEGFFRMVPPSPRGMIIPPTNPRLRGREVEVWVFVDTRGRVVADSTRLNPPTSDRGYNRRLIEEAAEWVFNPATRGGEPIAAWFPYTISM